MLEALSLMLSCPGSSTIQAGRVTPIANYGPDGRVTYSYSNQPVNQTYQATVRFRLTDGIGEVDIPAELLPKKRAGWHPVENLSVSDTEFSGTVKVRARKVPLKIDRVTGQMTMGKFAGRCEAYDAGHRKF